MEGDSLDPELKELFRRMLIDGLTDIRDAMEKKEYLSGHQDFPKLYTYNDSALPFFSKYDGYFDSTPKDYSSLWHGFQSTRNPPPSWEEFWIVAQTKKRIRQHLSLFWLDTEEEDTDQHLDIDKHLVLSFVGDFVDHYIHLYQTVEWSDDAFEDLYERVEIALLSETLTVDFLIPILLLDFELNDYAIDEDLTVERIADPVQLARNTKGLEDVSAHERVLGAALYALRLRDWQVPNDSRYRRRGILRNIEAYVDVIPKIDRFFAALRIATGEVSGYGQIITLPVGWSDSWKAQLEDLSVIAVRLYPDAFERNSWLRKPVQLSAGACEEIAVLYRALRDDTSNKLELASRRLNSAYLRRDDEDRILDITIGMEMLLTSDSRSEITYRLAVRLAALCSLVGFQGYTSDEVLRACKRLYDFRSAVAHGSKDMDKKRMIKIRPEEHVPAVGLGLDLLRHAIRVLTLHPEYLDLERLDAEMVLGLSDVRARRLLA